MPHFLLALALIGNLFSTVQPQPLGANVQVTDTHIDYRFGDEITFQARLVSDTPIQQTALFFQPTGEDTRVEPVTADGQGNVSYEYLIQGQPIRPFARVYYWFQITTGDGSQTTSPSFWFDYNDNRYQWQSLENPVFHIHWYAGGTDFGQTVANVAQSGLQSAQSLIPITPAGPLDIYVYSQAGDLQSALQLGGQPWTAGYANPDLGVVMVSIPTGPEQSLELERQIPHEISHVLLYQATGAGYTKIPIWLTEGLASVAELYPNPDYQRALDNARENDALLPISSLCQSFPQAASDAFLAYAKSASFTRYLHDHYGTTGLQNLIQRYTDGMGCSEAPAAVFGVSMDQLEARWKLDNLAATPAWVAFKNLAPYLALFALLLVVPLIALLRSLRKRQPTTHPEALK